jgi:hypothetical protein
MHLSILEFMHMPLLDSRALQVTLLDNGIEDGYRLRECVVLQDGRALIVIVYCSIETRPRIDSADHQIVGNSGESLVLKSNQAILDTICQRAYQQVRKSPTRGPEFNDIICDNTRS